jgi:hypothetical protein
MLKLNCGCQPLSGVASNALVNEFVNERELRIRWEEMRKPPLLLVGIVFLMPVIRIAGEEPVKYLP